MKRIDFSTMPHRNEFPSFDLYWEARGQWYESHDLEMGIEFVHATDDTEIHPTGWYARTFGCDCCVQTVEMTRSEAHNQLQLLIYQGELNVSKLKVQLTALSDNIQERQEEMDDVRESELQD